MILWFNKTDYKAYLKVQKTLESLIEDQQNCKDRQRALKSAFDQTDADMSALWDKVNHALARMGGRKSKRGADPVEETPVSPASVDDINRAIMKGELTEWHS